MVVNTKECRIFVQVYEEKDVEHWSIHSNRFFFPFQMGLLGLFQCHVNHFDSFLLYSCIHIGPPGPFCSLLRILVLVITNSSSSLRTGLRRPTLLQARSHVGVLVRLLGQSLGVRDVTYTSTTSVSDGAFAFEFRGCNRTPFFLSFEILELSVSIMG